MRRTRPILIALLCTGVFGLYAVACSDDENPPATPAVDSGAQDTGTTKKDGSSESDSSSPITDSGKDASVPSDAGDGGVQRGPISFDFDPSGNGDPISLVWDDKSSALYIADNRNNQIWKWTDSAGFTKFVTIPNDPIATDAGQTNLGQITSARSCSSMMGRSSFHASDLEHVARSRT